MARARRVERREELGGEVGFGGGEGADVRGGSGESVAAVRFVKTRRRMDRTRLEGRGSMTADSSASAGSRNAACACCARARARILENAGIAGLC